MRNDADSPYEPPTAAPTKEGTSRHIDRMQAIFCVHLVAIIASAFVVRSETILSSGRLEVLIALPLISTVVICPVAMLISAAVSIRRSEILFRGLTIGGDLVLSAIQLVVWLPTVQ